jgi:hypothetical protein
MKMALKRKNNEFLVMSLKHVLSVMCLVNHPDTPKLWAMAHEQAINAKNDEFFCHFSSKYINCHIPCKSLWNPKIIDNSSQKRS